MPKCVVLPVDGQIFEACIQYNSWLQLSAVGAACDAVQVAQHWVMLRRRSYNPISLLSPPPPPPKQLYSYVHLQQKISWLDKVWKMLQLHYSLPRQCVLIIFCLIAEQQRWRGLCRDWINLLWIRVGFMHCRNIPASTEHESGCSRQLFHAELLCESLLLFFTSIGFETCAAMGC